jgi:hypothetical protein
MIIRKTTQTVSYYGMLLQQHALHADVSGAMQDYEHVCNTMHCSMNSAVPESVLQPKAVLYSSALR